MKRLLFAAALLLASTAAHADVVLTISGGVCTGTFDNTGTLTITGCTLPVGSVTGAAPLASPTFTGTVTIPAGASISGFAPLASPTFTGTPTVPGYAPLASPALTGTPTVPTAAGTTNTTQAASTAMVQSAISAAAPSAYPVVAVASLPTVSASNKGALAFATNCRNTGQGAGAGTGCLVEVNSSGVWIAVWSGVAPTI